MKILLVGIDFFDYSLSLQHAFERLGHSVKTCEIKQNYGTLEKVYRELYGLYQRRIKHINPICWGPKLLQERRSKRIINEAREYQPDLLVCFPGYGLTAKALGKMGNFHKIIWVYDSIERLPDLLSVLPMYNNIFTFEGTDVQRYQKKGYEAEFLPLCVDDQAYYPIEAEKDIDILFIGNLSNSRVKELLDIREAFPNVNMVVYGRYSITLENDEELKNRLNKHQDIFTKKLVSVEDANILYSRSKICINLLHSQSQYGGNMRLYEICAAGGFQIVDSNPYIEENFSGCMVITHNSDEMKKAIEYYLGNDKERERIAKKGYDKIRKSELFVHRAKEILNKAIN